MAAAEATWNRALWSEGLRYGALGLPLAFVALPLYVQLPHYYADRHGVALATMGVLLLAARLVDALADPWIGRAADRWLGASIGWTLRCMAAAAVLLAAGFHALFFPLPGGGTALVLWCAVWLVITYLAWSCVTLPHQAWGARLGGDEVMRTRIVSWREGLALVGVLLATALPSLAGPAVAGAVFTLALAVGLALLARAALPQPQAERAPAPLVLPLRSAAFRRLLAVHLLNGVASAVPATLVIFFIRDRLQAASLEPLFLFAYFAAAAMSMPLWVRLVARWGLVRAWLAGMALAIAAFVGAAGLGAGDVLAYLAVCVACGVALGADLALPGALLAGVVQREGHDGQAEGGYFGWWNLASKLNLALAAGVALPLLQALGYAPGRQDGAALQALALSYAVLPCVLKALAALLLWLNPPLPHPR